MDDDGSSPVFSSPLGGKLSSGAAAGVAAACFALAMLYIIGRLACQYRKGLPRNGATSAPRPSSCPPLREEEDEMAPLPVFVHVAGGGSAEENVRCAVCLAEFAHGEAGRLVPGCGHGFHAACIEAWIRVNSTCPLCRGAVVAGAEDHRSVEPAGESDRAINAGNSLPDPL